MFHRTAIYTSTHSVHSSRDEWHDTQCALITWRVTRHSTSYSPPGVCAYCL